MREIKFRGYEEDCGMIYSDKGYESVLFEINNSGDGGVFVSTEINDWQHDEKFMIMQYTGLKDKNGKEIYEGDILQFTWYEDSCWGRAGIYKGYVGFDKGVFKVIYINREEITKYDDGSWHNNRKSDDIESLFSWSEEIEVIGNIYENKDLMMEESNDEN